MQLFDFTKTLFNDPIEWRKLTKSVKRKNFFMTSQFMSIAFPLQAQLLNHIKINQEASLDFWQKFMRQRYNKTPFWMFIKGRVKNKEAKENKTVSKALIAQYCKAHNLELKTIDDALLHFPDEIIKEIKKFDKIITQK